MHLCQVTTHTLVDTLDGIVTCEASKVQDRAYKQLQPSQYASAAVNNAAVNRAEVNHAEVHHC